MDLKKLTWPAAAAAALCCATCAPVEKPPPPQGEADAAEKPPAEVLTQLPAPVPDGPRYRIESAVRNIRERDVLTTNGFWTVFHAILGLGPGVPLLNPQTGERVNAVDYICGGGELQGLQFVPTRNGADVVTTGFAGGGQGHQDQFIAEMAQWGMPLDRRFVVLGNDYTYRDFVHHTQMRARVTANQELSWAIVVIGQYLGTDVSWTNDHKERLRFEDLLRYELDAPVETAACGGTHRLFGLAWVYHLHLQKGGKTEGVWKEIADKTARYRDLAKKYQNGDGSFSTDFFRGPGNAADKQLRVNTTGHTLEWLALALSDAELKEQWVQDAANALALMILDMQGQPIEGGSLYHAVHGLLLYYARVYDRHTLGPPELFFPLPPGWGKGESS
jgi:hypothetical protein